MKAIKIKSIILTGLALVTINIQGKAKETKRKIIKETLTSDIINVSADSLWAICREFDKNAEWTSTLNHSFGSGEPIHVGANCSTRTCETSFGKGGKVVEELTMFSDDKMELAYDQIEGAPGFITYAHNHWKVIEVGPNQSKLEMNVNIHMKKFAGFFLGRAIAKVMKKHVNIVLDEIKIYVETGDISEAKKKQIEKQKKKK